MIRNCKICQKEYDHSGVNCYSCSRKLREAKRAGRPCSICKRTDVCIVIQNPLLCVMCDRKKRAELDSTFLERRLNYQRKLDRKKSGRPLDSPLILKPRGSGYVDEMGYKRISKKDHPNASKNKYRIFEHTYVMSEYLGRPLKKGESVHHKNGIRSDNRIENLELWNKQQPPGQRVEDKIKWAKEFLEEYGYNVIMKENP